MKPEFIEIPAGTFLMGSPQGEKGRWEDETQHDVTITRPYLMQKTPITQRQWREVMGNNPSHFSKAGDDAPVEQVSWFDAVAYCNALSRKEGLAEAYIINGTDVQWRGFDCNGYRLPTEAEWEYAYRAGTTTAFYNGDCTQPRGKGPKPDQIGWYDENSGKTTHPVGQKQPNAWGLYDMAGNVWEWCWDWYSGYGGSTTDPVGSSSGSSRVYRGGSWGDYARYCRAAFRFNYGPAFRNFNLGFRLSRSD